MSRNAWFKFYPNDWLSDPNLKLCSYEAKGIWMDLICYAHNSEKYGFLVINSKNFDKKMIKKMLKLKNSGIKSLNELIDNGVIGIAEDGAFYSRRLLKEKKLVDESRVHGLRGGNPKLVKGGVKGGGAEGVKLEVRSKSKEIRDKSKKEKINKKEFLEFVELTEEEHKKLIVKFGSDGSQIWIEKLNSHIGSKGTKYKSHYFTILSWSNKELKSGNNGSGNNNGNSDLFDKIFDFAGNYLMSQKIPDDYKPPLKFAGGIDFLKTLNDFQHDREKKLFIEGYEHGATATT